ncbi:nucleotidyltransferase [Patescibacteria group bacterium]|nr:nucleotidyltransferase [Patescibacteria group bacterium]
MSIATKFENLCKNILISQNDADKISSRYKAITKRLNKDFWNTESEESHSLYVGSYGRDTDIHVSDVDMIFQLPYSVYETYNNYLGNGQSSLLQAVRTSLQKTYSTTHIKGDGQIIGINWDDGICFEIVPCFINKDDSYTFPDSNNGGSWKTTNPKPEIKAIREKNVECNYNLKSLCRMIRAWKDNCSVPLGGLLIDTFAYNFLSNWQYKDKSFLYYDWMVRDFFEYLKNQNEDQEYWLAPGSNQRVNRKGKFNYKAKLAYNTILEAMKAEEYKYEYTANQKWKEVFGLKF